MKLSGLHILLTYQCTYECEHCFVWGSPRQTGTLTLDQVEQILAQAKDAGVEWIYFEGGEPFLYYAVLVRGVQLARGMGLHVGVVSNAYWANSVADAHEWLKPFKGLVEDLSVSSDLYHCEECLGERPQNALVAAKWLNIPTGIISIAQPEAQDETSLMYRGRASQMAARAAHHPWDSFTECPHEDLREPGRVHLDPLGNLHICQGLVIGNLFDRTFAYTESEVSDFDARSGDFALRAKVLFEKSLKQICEEYDADAHPICGPLLSGGPAALVTEYNLPHASDYADACHLCYEARTTLRPRFPAILAPDQMYGVMK